MQSGLIRTALRAHLTTQEKIWEFYMLFLWYLSPKTMVNKLYYYQIWLEKQKTAWNFTCALSVQRLNTPLLITWSKVPNKDLSSKGVSIRARTNAAWLPTPQKDKQEKTNWFVTILTFQAPSKLRGKGKCFEVFSFFCCSKFSDENRKVLIILNLETSLVSLPK